MLNVIGEIIGALFEVVISVIVGMYVTILQESRFVRNGLFIIFALLTLASCIISFSTVNFLHQYEGVAGISACIFGVMLVFSVAAFLPRLEASRDSKSDAQIPSVLNHEKVKSDELTVQMESNPKMASQPPLPKLFIGLLTAVWPIELTLACILPASVAVVVWGAERNLVQLIGISMFVGAVGYMLGHLRFEFREARAKLGSEWWLKSWGCSLLFGGIVAMSYYLIVASVCRHTILPIVYRIARISDARIPSVFDDL